MNHLMRLTLLEPLDNFEAKLKYHYSEYENDGGGTAWSEEGLCPDGATQLTGIPVQLHILQLEQVLMIVP